MEMILLLFWITAWKFKQKHTQLLTVKIQNVYMYLQLQSMRLNSLGWKTAHPKY